MKISVFGLGYVGCVSATCLAQTGHQVVGVDINESKVRQINAGFATIVERDLQPIVEMQVKRGNLRATVDHREAVLGSDLSIISVGTPSTRSGHLNLDIVFEAVRQIGQALTQKNTFHTVLIRSTVLPGTNEKCYAMLQEAVDGHNSGGFAVIMNPEFLREGSAVHDYLNPPFILIGGYDPLGIEAAKLIYKDIKADVTVTDAKTAEMIKLASNSFHALKVGFANEIGRICQALEIDPLKLMEIFVNDRILNISPVYLRPGFAYGGSCLPKDLKCLQILAHDHYIDTPILSAVDKSNQLQVLKAYEMIAARGLKKIGVFGLTFKAGTDDLRNSPVVDLVEMLLGKGFEVRIFDRNLELSRIQGSNKEYINTHLPHISSLLSDCYSQVLDFCDVCVISNNDPEIADILMSVDRKPIIDLVHIGRALAAKKNYSGICW